MTDYSKMSDFEINKMVCDVFWPYFNKSSECKNKTFPQKSSVVYMENGYGGLSRDYCNNPADAWPIIVGNKINIRFGAEGMSCEAQFMQYGHESIEQYHANPLRAAMIVFLMMREKKE